MYDEEKILDIFEYYNDTDKFKNLDDVQAFTLNKAVKSLLTLYANEKQKNLTFKN